MKNNQIDFVLNELRIDLIHKALVATNTKWKDQDGKEDRVPTENEIRVIAEFCIRQAFKSETGIFKIGGFEAEVIRDVVGIKFILTESNPLSKILG